MENITLNLTEDEARLLYRVISEMFLYSHNGIGLDYPIILLMNKLSKVLEMDKGFKTVWNAPGFEDNAKVLLYSLIEEKESEDEKRRN